MTTSVWIQTFTGIAFCPLNPHPSTVSLTDIAHALSMICRFNGHSRDFYSVAEHCVVMSEMVPEQYALAALMHDAAEAYVSDVARPLKPVIGNFANIERAVEDAIRLHFGLFTCDDEESVVKAADLRMLATERRQLMTMAAPEWDSLRGVDPYGITLECWSPAEAKTRFLSKFQALYPRAGVRG